MARMTKADIRAEEARKGLAMDRLNRGECKSIIRLAAKNDCDGNPRRVFVMLDSGGRIIGVVDEGYSGYRAVPDVVRKSHEFWPVTFETTASEYRGLLNAFGI